MLTKRVFSESVSSAEQLAWSQYSSKLAVPRKMDKGGNRAAANILEIPRSGKLVWRVAGVMNRRPAWARYRIS